MKDIKSIAMDRRSLLRTMGGLGAGALGLGSLAGCGGDGEALEPIASDLLATTPENQAATYRNVDRLFPVRRFSAKPGAASALPMSSRSLAQLSYSAGGKTRTLEEFIAGNRISGMLVLKNGAIAYEKYAMGNTPQTRWTSFSVAKSLTSTLLGAALADGAIGSLDDPVVRYLPEMRDSAYGDNTIRQVACMSSGVRWNENYSVTAVSDLALMRAARQTGRKGDVMALMRTRPRAAAPGAVFNYSTGESYVLGAVVAAATKSNMSDYLARKIWVPCGMEDDGYWMLDAPDGLELGGQNFSARLRDYGRLGQFFMNDGQNPATRVLPVGWRNEAGQPQLPVAGYGRLAQGYPLGYGYQWWALPPGVAGARQGSATFTGQGVFGQFLYINPDEQLVVVLWSAWREAWIGAVEAEFYTLLGSVVDALH